VKDGSTFAPKYVLKGVVLKAGPFAAGVLCGASPAVTVTAIPYGVELEEPVTVVLVAVVCAPAIEQSRENAQRTAELRNRGIVRQGEVCNPSN
jgi:hypothetical protein